MSPGHKTCSKCGELKSIEEFYKVKPRWNSDRTADCKSCVKARANVYYENNREDVLVKENKRRAQGDWPAKCREYKRKHWAKRLLLAARKSSKDRGHDPPEIDEAWIERQPLVCPYLGVILVPDSGKSRDPFAPSLDRIDNSRGYTRDNVRVTSWVWNLMRGALTVEEALEVVAVIKAQTTVKAA